MIKQRSVQMDLDQKYYLELAAAFVMGSVRRMNQEQLVLAGQAAGLKLQRFRRKEVLPRVARVIEILKLLQPTSLLDVGGGSGSSLIAMLAEFPDLEVDAIDSDEERVLHLQALASGLGCPQGYPRLSASMGDVMDLGYYAEKLFDGVIALEVLEHVEKPEKAVAEIMRVAKKFVIASVPSEPDTNPRHLHLLTPQDLEKMFSEAGAKKVVIERVPGHIIALATKEEP